jgi:hypothetical protein
MLKKILLSGLVVLGFAAEAAKQPSARIDVVGIKQKITLTIDQTNKVNSKPHNPSWAKANTPFYICAPGPQLKTSEWTDYAFSFTPDKDGSLRLQLMGSLTTDPTTKKRAPLWTAWKDFEVLGAEANNLDFSQTKPNGQLESWNLKPEQYIAAEKIVKSWHDGRIVQSIKVKAGQKVTIKAKVKPLQ